MMFYIDVLAGCIGTLGYFWLMTSRPMHRWLHTKRDGMFLRGRLVCRHCFDEVESLTKDEWREEFISKLRRYLTRE